jgi:hypothetical protein
LTAAKEVSAAAPNAAAGTAISKGFIASILAREAGWRRVPGCNCYAHAADGRGSRLKRRITKDCEPGTAHAWLT